MVSGDLPQSVLLHAVLYLGHYLEVHHVIGRVGEVGGGGGRGRSGGGEEGPVIKYPPIILLQYLIFLHLILPCGLGFC